MLQERKLRFANTCGAAQLGGFDLDASTGCARAFSFNSKQLVPFSELPRQFRVSAALDQARLHASTCVFEFQVTALQKILPYYAERKPFSQFPREPAIQP